MTLPSLVSVAQCAAGKSNSLRGPISTFADTQSLTEAAAIGPIELKTSFPRTAKQLTELLVSCRRVPAKQSLTDEQLLSLP